MHGEEETFLYNFFCKIRNPDTHGSIILKWILKTVCECMHWIHLARNSFLLQDVKNVLKLGEGIEVQLFQEHWSYLNVLGATKVTRNDCHTENPQILGETVQTLVGTATWKTGSMHSWHRALKKRDISWHYLRTFASEVRLSLTQLRKEGIITRDKG